MIRWLLLLLAAWWLSRVVRRFLVTGRRGEPRVHARARQDDRPDPLTRQEIADADFEEISEKE
ncbi:MAG: hypothetical protein R6X25_01330 [Candidatus Krumholzibacteriia bacterium]